MADVVKNISLSKFGPNERDFLLQICVHIHKRYDNNFSFELVKAIKDQYRATSVLTDATRKRNILRMLTELYFKGLIEEYKSFFGCLNTLIIELRETDGPDY